jgi:Uncharacterized conserved protein
MCGRYFISIEENELKKIIREIEENKDNTDLAKMKTGEIFPTDIVPIITAQSVSLMKWGFTRYDGKGQVINARIETIYEKAMFRKSFIETRCLVPASNFFEWEKRGTKKQKYAIGTNGVIFMAGLYRLEQDSLLPRFVILTRPATENLSFIHNRIPVILPPDTHKSWLSGNMDNNNALEYSTENLNFAEVY